MPAIILDRDKMANEKNEDSEERETFKLIKKYLLEFDVLKSTEQEARNLIAWLQVEIKSGHKDLSDNLN